MPVKKFNYYSLTKNKYNDRYKLIGRCNFDNTKGTSSATAIFELSNSVKIASSLGVVSEVGVEANAIYAKVSAKIGCTVTNSVSYSAGKKISTSTKVPKGKRMKITAYQPAYETYGNLHYKIVDIEHHNSVIDSNYLVKVNKAIYKTLVEVTKDSDNVMTYKIISHKIKK